MVWLTTYFQLTIHNHEEWLNGNLAQHNLIMQGVAGNPWQYRLLADYLLEGLFRVISGLGAQAVYLRGFVLFRLTQEVLIFTIGLVYLRKLGLSTNAALVGLSMLMAGMVFSQETTGFRVDTYADVIFYLVAGILTLSRRFMWLVLVAVLAAANRETSGLIPFLPLAYVQLRRPLSAMNRPVYGAMALSLLAFIVVQVALRVAVGPQGPSGTTGLEMVHRNLNNDDTFVRLTETLGVLPLLTVAWLGRLPRFVQTLFWLMVPAWFAIHLWGSILIETTLFMVPFIMVFIPAVLLVITSEGRPADPTHIRLAGASRTEASERTLQSVGER
jgi:hypothetical protein